MHVWKAMLIILLGGSTLMAGVPSRSTMRQPESPVDYHITTEPITLPRDSTVSYSALDTLLPQLSNDFGVVGLVASIYQDGETVWTGSFGQASTSPSTPMTDSTFFPICSISKSFTGTALMQLWEQGLFNLNDPINDYLPFTILHPNFPDSLITFDQLLTFTAALRDNYAVFRWLTTPYDFPQTLHDYLVDYFVPGGAYYYDQINFCYDAYPGEAFDYCNMNYVLIAYLVELLSGMPFADYCEQNIFQPLGMNQSSWFLADTDTTRLAHGHDAENIPRPYIGSPIWPAALLKSNPQEMWRFMRTIMNGGEYDGGRLLDSTTVALMLQPRVSMVPFLWHDYGYAFHEERIVFDSDTMDVWGHCGSWSESHVTYMCWCEETETACIAMINSFDQPAMIELYRLLLSVAWNEWLSVDDAPDPLPETFAITNVYPNPFNQEARIRYQLARSSSIRVSLYNLLGQRIMLLDMGVQSPGQHDIAFQPDGIASGAYLLRLETPATSDTRRVIHLK